MKTWLVIAAERRELEGVLRRCEGSKELASPGVKFAREVSWRGDRWWLLANGPGRGLVEKALERKMEVNGLISTGFCGALDPALKIGDIVTGSRVITSGRVAVTAGEKRALRASTGAAAVEMEADAVAAKAAEWQVPFHCVKAVSDLAEEDMPLDFNLYRDAEGRFSQSRIAMAALAKPFTRIPALLRLERNCRTAAESLGVFFADCRF
jgi:adenosylhomocysteine nucleosidase